MTSRSTPSAPPPRPIGNRPSLALCMIVRNEAAVIERCVSSARELIDFWVICDTGSSDGTPDLVQKALPGVPGDLHRRPWVNFGHNRSELLALARGKAEFLLLLDADMTVEVTGRWPAKLPDACMLRIPAPQLDYRLPLLVRGDLAWRSEGVTHEFITTDGPYTQAPVDAIVIHHHLDGGMRHEKLERDLGLLKADWERDPSQRNAFYIAQTYRDMGDLAEAVSWYERRAEMGGWEEEVFYSLWQVGTLREKLGDWPQAMTDLIRAWQYRPQRLEPVYDLTAGLRVREQYHAAHLFAAAGIDKPQPPDVLFVHAGVYRWGMLFEYSITSYWVGEFNESVRVCNRLLKMDDLPEPYRSQTVANRRLALQRLAQDMASRPPRRMPPGSSTPSPRSRRTRAKP